MSRTSYTRDEIMTIAASRMLWDGCVCFVGIGLPSAASNLARLTHAPGIVLIYESGTIGTEPRVLPLSIGDEDLAKHASCIVSIPEIFSYWLQAGRVDVGFLGAAQVDRWGNINTTVIGDYHAPSVRLPGAGGAPEIASHARQTFIMLRQSKRSFVDQLDFKTSAGYLGDTRARARTGARGRGPQALITDLGILRPDPATGEFILTELYPGVETGEVVAATGWALKISPAVARIDPPSPGELDALRDLHARTQAAHRTPPRLPFTP